LTKSVSGYLVPDRFFCLKNRRLFLFVLGATALAAHDLCVFFRFSFFPLYYPGCYQFATVIADELYFSDAIVGLKNLNGQFYFPSFATFSLASKYSTYSRILRLLSLALFLMSS
jgi:hypothetical protein